MEKNLLKKDIPSPQQTIGKVHSFIRIFSILIASTVTVLSITACGDDVTNIYGEEPETTPPVPTDTLKHRTILAYIWGDIENSVSLSQSQLDYINRMEAGWQDNFDGDLYVYLDPSPHFVQFTQPVLLKIMHDETPAIVSEIVESYEPIEPGGDITRYPEIQNRVREIAPAETYGLMLFGHGSGALMINSSAATKGMGGGYNKYLENKELAELTLEGYEYIIFHACQMASVEVAYEFRNKADYMVGSEVELYNLSWPFEQIMSYLFAKPQADLSNFTITAAQWLYNTSMNELGWESCESTASLIDLKQMDRLAAATRQAFVENNIYKATIKEGLMACHFVNNTGTTDPGFYDNLQDLTVDLAELMYRLGILSDEWIEAYNQACLINATFFTLPMFDEYISFYNGLSIYPMLEGILQANNEEGEALINSWLENYQGMQWYQDCGFAEME